ncbi:MAG: 4-hydroxythreonine-4-phosphate dehydrogenase PdxA [Rikenellaceae bacterium]
MSDKRTKIAITQGDTNGVGWEIILKIFSDRRMCEICTPVIYGSLSAAEYYKKSIEEFDNFSFNVVSSAKDARSGKVNLVECGKVARESIAPGTASQEAGVAAIEALTKAVEELKSGFVEGVVTGPFNKETVQSDTFAHTGHTEFMAANFEGADMMMMCSELLKVGLVTKHLPLEKVKSAINKDLIVKDLKALRKTLITDFSVVEPRIAVLSLNPHAGDGGLLGTEEKDVIQPAIAEAFNDGVLAFGPFAADGFFAASTYRKYDAILAMYHDQGLIPFKTLSPDGVNFTAGLSAVRTSPDHGVAYDIAGQDKADPASMRNAIYMAIDVIASRKIYDRISANPLERVEQERERGDSRGLNKAHSDGSFRHGGGGFNRERYGSRDNRQPREYQKGGETAAIPTAPVAATNEENNKE